MISGPTFLSLWALGALVFIGGLLWFED